jgi:Histidinol dehydrogenase
MLDGRHLLSALLFFPSSFTSSFTAHSLYSSSQKQGFVSTPSFISEPSTFAVASPARTFSTSPKTPIATTTPSTTGRAMTILNHITPAEVSLEIKDPVDAGALEQARAIITELTEGAGGSKVIGADALLTVAKRLGDLPPDATTADLVVSGEACREAYESLTDEERTALVNIHGRVKAFADMQRRSVTDMEMDIPGGKAGHTVSPCRGAWILFIMFVKSGWDDPVVVPPCIGGPLYMEVAMF